MSRLTSISAFVIACAAMVVPLLNLAVPPDSFFHIADHMVPLLGK